MLVSGDKTLYFDRIVFFFYLFNNRIILESKLIQIITIIKVGFTVSRVTDKHQTCVGHDGNESQLKVFK